MKDFEKLAEVKKESKEIYDGVILHVLRDTVILPNGREAGRELIRHVGAVAVVPVDDEGNVYIERQYRYPLDAVITEIPAGKLDSKSEDRLSAAKRELKEETGISAEEWTDMGLYYPAAAYSDEKINIYLARKLDFGEQMLDEDEFLNFKAVPMKELVEDVMAGRITDGKTQVGLLKAAKILGVI